jgi:anaerobic selenocysteine-containing dehydrogenase
VPRDERSYCRICAAACGIVVTIDGDRVVRVRGDDQHPVSRGYTCSKGRGIAAWHHASNRLDRPRVGGRECTWDELLTDLGARLDAVIDAEGPDAVALYLATGMAYDAAGQIAASTWLPAIGSRSFLTAVTVDNAPVLVAAELVSGEPMLNPVWNPVVPGLAIFVGTNPVVSHGYGTALPDPVRRVRDYRAAGGRVWVLDPRRTETAAVADVHVPVRPGADVVVIAALARALLEHGSDERELREHCDPGEVRALRAALRPFTIERAARAADVDPALLDQLVAGIRDAPGRVAMQCGTGVTMSRDGVLAEWLRWVVLIASGSLDRASGMHFHRGLIRPLRRRTRRAEPLAPPASRPELPRVVGQLPALALADEIEAGHIRALLVTGGNPLTAFPQPARLRDALAALDVLAVVDVAETPLTALATHVLPATGQLERADVTLAEATALEARLQATSPVVGPVAERRPVWWMFAALNGAMRYGPGPGADLDRTDEQVLRGALAHARVDADDLFAAGPHGVARPIEYGWVREELLADARWHIAPAPLLDRLASYAEPEPAAFVLAPRREMAWSNSIRYGPEHAERVVRMHADDIVRMHADDIVRMHADDIVRMHPDAVTADAVTLATDHGVLTTHVVADPTVRAGVVSITHGRPDENPGDLTSTDADVDALTAMPRVAGLDVRVSGAARRSDADASA